MRRVTGIAHCRSGAANLRFQLTTARVTTNINNITANLQKPNRKGHKKATNGYPCGLNRRGSPVLPAKRATINNGFGRGSRSGGVSQSGCARKYCVFFRAGENLTSNMVSCTLSEALVIGIEASFISSGLAEFGWPVSVRD